MTKVTRTAPTGGTAPALTAGPNISGLSTTGATIAWSLNQFATGQVEYGPTTGYGSFTTKEASFNYTNHIQAISGLTANTLYHYRLLSDNSTGDAFVSGDYTFTTLATQPGTRPFAAPVTTNVVQVLAGANVQSVVGAAPDGTEFVFAVNTTFNMSSGIYLRNRHNLVFTGNNATIQSTTGNPGSTDSSGFKLDNLNSDIAIRNFNIIGTNPDTGSGIYHGGIEGQHGVLVWDSQRVEVDNCRISAVYGDGFYVGGWNTPPYRQSQDIWVHDNSFDYIGRMGWVPNNVNNLTIERCTLDHVGLIAIDVEPDAFYEGVSNLHIQDNVIGAYSLSGTQTNWFFANAAVHGCVHSNFNIERNSVTVGASVSANNPANKGGLATRVTTTDRVNGFNFRDNTTTVVGGGNTFYPGCINFQHVDGLVVTGNTQPMSGGTMIAISDCPGAITSPNP